jgi:hypothetical protein
MRALTYIGIERYFVVRADAGTGARRKTNFQAVSLSFLVLPHVDQIRRLMNQAIFEAIWIEVDEELRIYTRSKLASPFADVHSIKDEIAAFEAEHDKAPDPLTGSEALVAGYISDEMVGETGAGGLVVGALLARGRPRERSG